VETLQAPATFSDSILNRRARTTAYIRSAAFDSTLLLAPLFTGLVVAAITVGNPRLFPVLLFADVWLLGYHHVVATYTRLAFDRSSLRTNRFLAVDLLVLMIGAVFLLTLWGGAWVIATAFLYLQWFHYMRQGYGLSRMYFRATDRSKGTARDFTTDAVVYTVPIYCIAQRSATMGDTFLGSPVATVVLPASVIAILGGLAAASVAVWTLQAASDWWHRRLDLHYAAFVASHVLIFLVGYVIVDDVNIGWLAVNVWHNFQYVLVVWMVNTKRFARGIDPAARLLSMISQPDRIWVYFGTCLAISTFVYFNVNQVTAAVLGGSLAATLGVYMGINFHHYVVDALIWKRPRAAAATRA
jgi:hypothetical protein